MSLPEMLEAAVITSGTCWCHILYGTCVCAHRLLSSRTDRQTDRQTDGQTVIMILEFSQRAMQQQPACSRLTIVYTYHVPSTYISTYR